MMRLISPNLNESDQDPEGRPSSVVFRAVRHYKHHRHSQDKCYDHQREYEPGTKMREKMRVRHEDHLSHTLLLVIL